jgi:hypothetical protein
MSGKMAVIFAGLCFVGLSGAAPPDSLSNGGLPSSSGVIALNSLPNPSATLATAAVADAKGTMVGAVHKIILDASGQPQTVDVTLLGSNAVVAIAASQFNYDQGHNVLTAALDAQQIAAEPPAPQG